jgi:hypothetical protein
MTTSKAVMKRNKTLSRLEELKIHTKNVRGKAKELEMLEHQEQIRNSHSRDQQKGTQKLRHYTNICSGVPLESCRCR